MTALDKFLAEVLKRVYDWVVFKASGLKPNGEWWIVLPNGRRERVA